MIIHYCEKCGLRIAPADVEAGKARVTEEGKATCPKCIPSRRSSERIPVGAPIRDSKLGLKPLRRDSKINITPATPGARISDRTSLPPAMPTAPHRNRVLLIGGGIATVLLFVVLALALGGSHEQPEPDAAPETSPPDKIAQLALPPASTNTAEPLSNTAQREPVPPATTHVEPAVSNKKEPDTYDPRSSVAQSLLEQAKAAYAEDPDDPWKYEEKLKALVAGYANTGASKEAQSILETLNPGPKPADPSLPAEEEWAKARDLMPLADPTRQTVSGQWTLKDGALLTPKEGRSKLALPYRLPEEYDLRLVFTRVEGNNNLCVNLTHLGQPLTFHLASWGNKTAGWEMLDGKRVNDIRSSIQRSKLLENNRRYTLIIQMHRDRWAAFLDGQLLVKRNRDLNRSLSQYKDALFPDPKRLGLLTNDSAYRVEEIKVLELTGTGTLIEAGDIATAPEPQPELTATPATTSTPDTPPSANRAAYAVFMRNLQNSLAQQAWETGEQRLQDALKAPELADKSALLKLDLDCLHLAASVPKAVSAGALALKDGRSFTLRDVRGKKYAVGRKTKVLKADDAALTIQQDVGGGQITVDLPITELTDETRFELARLGLPVEAKSQLALALDRLCIFLKERSPESRKAFDFNLEMAVKAQAPEELLNHVKGWLKLMEREEAARQAFQTIEQLTTGQKGPEATTALADFVKTYDDTVFYVEKQPEVPELKSRIERLFIQPGLVARYYSGDSKNKRQTHHSSEVVKTLDHNWNDKGPAEGVPADHFLVEFKGVLRIAEAGEYTIAWGADDGLEVWIDGKSHGKNKTSGMKLDLTAGDHPFKAVFTEGSGTASLWMKWKPPGETKSNRIPASAFFHMPGDAEEGK